MLKTFSHILLVLMAVGKGWGRKKNIIFLSLPPMTARVLCGVGGGGQESKVSDAVEL